MKKFISFIIFLLIYVSLPHTWAPVIHFLYEKKFHEQVDAGLRNISRGNGYCIIAPTVDPASKHPFRKWIAIHDPEKLDLQHILDHAIREKLVFLANEGRSLKERAEIGREIHFGLSLEDEFYIWSFLRGRFVRLPVDGLTSYEKEIIGSYAALRQYQDTDKAAIAVDLDDYYCRHLTHESPLSSNSRARPSRTGSLHGRDKPGLPRRRTGALPQRIALPQNPLLQIPQHEKCG